MKKQTDYDKALGSVINYIKANNTPDMRLSTTQDIIEYAFYQGYEYGKQLSTADHERNLIALGDDYMTARERAVEQGYNKWLDSDADYDTLDAYRQGWDDADAFDEEWTKQHPRVLFDRLLADHPEIIENEVKTCMKDIRNEQAESDLFRDSTKMMRYDAAKAAMQALLTNGMKRHVISKAIQYADNLINELDKS